MKLKKYIILCLITSLTGGLSAQKTMTGIEVLKKDNFKILEDRKSTRLNSSHSRKSRMPSSA